MPINDTKIVKALEGKYVEIFQSDNSASDALAALEIVIKLWRPEWSPKAVKITKRRSKFAKRGLQSKMIYSYITVTEGNLTTEGAANYTLRRLKLKRVDLPPKKNIKANAHRIFRKLEGYILVATGSRPECWNKN